MTQEISLSTAGLIESADKSLRQCRQKAEIPFWAVPLPLPPEYDFLDDVEADRRLAGHWQSEVESCGWLAVDEVTALSGWK